MKKEEFVALGISEELAVKAEKASQNELKGYVEKVRQTSSFSSGSESSNLNPANANLSSLTTACASKTFPLSTTSNPKVENTVI